MTALDPDRIDKWVWASIRIAALGLGIIMAYSVGVTLREMRAPPVVDAHATACETFPISCREDGP